MLRTELAFYVGCLNLREQLAKKGEPICFPFPTAAQERRHSFNGLYDVCLTLSLEQRVVGVHFLFCRILPSGRYPLMYWPDGLLQILVSLDHFGSVVPAIVRTRIKDQRRARGLTLELGVGDITEKLELLFPIEKCAELLGLVQQAGRKGATAAPGYIS